MYDNQQEPKGWPLDIDRAAQEIAGTAARTMSQLLPFPGADAVVLPLLSPGRTHSAQPPQSLGSIGEVPADLVSRAATILDQEMAKGVVAAQRGRTSSSSCTT